MEFPISLYHSEDCVKIYNESIHPDYMYQINRKGCIFSKFIMTSNAFKKNRNVQKIESN